MLEKEIIKKNNITIETKKAIFINNNNRWMLIISSTLIALSFIISWAIWASLYKKELNELLDQVTTYLQNKGYDFEIDFYGLSILTLLYAGFGIITVPIFALIFRKKKFFAFMTAIIGLIYAIIIFTTISLLFYICIDTFEKYFRNYSLSNSLILILPWILEALFGLILIINTLWLLFSFFVSGKDKKVKNDVFEKETMLEELKNNASSKNIFWETEENFAQQPAPNNNSHNINNHPIPPATVTTINPTLISDEDNNNELTTTWTQEQIEQNWNKALISSKLNPHLYRFDYAGALIFKNSFINNPQASIENNNSKSYNWTIVRKKPLHHGGTNNDDNLLPSHTINALNKNNHYPKWKTALTFDGQENVQKTKKWKY